MKKTFQLAHPKIKYPRMIEAIKADIRKYLKRNRRKTLPEGFDFWDFDCKFGAIESDAEKVHLTEIDKHINQAEKDELQSFYVEIIGRAAKRQKK
ncbi:DUF6172 family protein [Lentisphaera profundi]|uniref:DUF6172 family protein n=1 Tax=Lentisphaera profundi TaxID=1658616 RepID=A0ABY7VWF5_9BACT|nr:DUF6172 family protein [Lentisphaera profundi]WDE98236.1 DUF6172 family protein [Lentisphaera profundi]